jgi:hypothetical protein
MKGLALASRSDENHFEAEESLSVGNRLGEAAVCFPALIEGRDGPCRAIAEAEARAGSLRPSQRGA